MFTKIGLFLESVTALVAFETDRKCVCLCGRAAITAHTALCWTALHCITLHYTALHYIALHYTALHCTAVHCATLSCITLNCIILYCTALHMAELFSAKIHFSLQKRTGLYKMYCAALH